MPTDAQVEVVAHVLHESFCMTRVYEGEGDDERMVGITPWDWLSEDSRERYRAIARATTRAAEALDPIEWGIEYEATSTESIYTVAHSEKQARKWVAQSPTDTGLRKRRAPGDWEQAE